MKKWLVGAVLAIVSAFAFATPSPRMIEDALASQHYNDARGMVNQVLEEHPDSARAHLLNAFILIHADHNKQAAAQELDTARRDDQRGDVKNSPLFGRTAAEIEMTKTKAAPVVQQQTIQQAANSGPLVQQEQPKHEGHGFLFFMLFLIALGIIGYVIYRLCRPRVVVQERHVYHDPVRSVDTTASSAWDGASIPAYTPPRSVGYVAPAPVAMAPSGPVIVNNGGMNNGFIEGMVIGELMSGGRHHDTVVVEEDRYERRRRDSDSYSSSTVPDSSYDASPSSSNPVSYQSDRQSFSSGSDDSWSSRSSDSSSYDSGSSSSSWSSDSSSSSSYDSGSSSWDSGSSYSSSDSSW